MIILNLFKRIKINLKYLLEKLRERFLLLLAILWCSTGYLSLALNILNSNIRRLRMDQEIAAQQDEIDMIIDVDEFDDEDIGVDNLDEEPYESDDDSDDMSGNENDYNMNIDEDSESINLTRCGGKALYQFRPLRLMRDMFLFKNILDVPIARSGHRIIANAGNLYSLGGYNPRAATNAERDGRCMLFQELWCYNFATKHWKILMTGESMPNMPRELASNALVMYNNVLISYGGTGFPFGETCSNDCYVFSTGRHYNTPFLARLTVTGDLPTPLYGPAIVIHENSLYTIGGTTGFDYSCDVFRLNLKTRQWESVYISRPEMRDDPEGRYRHEIVYDGKYIYLLGGGTSLYVYDLQRLPAFNLELNKWEFFETLPDRTMEAAASAVEAPGETIGYPRPRKCFSCVQHKMDNGDIEAFITGGLQGDFSSYFDDVWKLNIRTMQWTLIRTAKLPKALYFHSAADNGIGLMHIFGGIEYDSKEMRRRNRVYKMWMTIPKLSEICWDAITYYNERLSTYDSKTLLSCGIPSRFVDRIEFQPKKLHCATTASTEDKRQSSMACTSL